MKLDMLSESRYLAHSSLSTEGTVKAEIVRLDDGVWSVEVIGLPVDYGFDAPTLEAAMGFVFGIFEA